jgi:competence protein ComEA
LLPLPGIGPVYAGRIIKYRNLPGGLISMEQLLEVYGISNETLDRIRDRIVIDTSLF